MPTADRKPFFYIGDILFDANTIHRIQKVDGGFAVYQIEPDGTVEQYIVKTEVNSQQLYNSLRFD